MCLYRVWQKHLLTSFPFFETLQSASKPVKITNGGACNCGFLAQEVTHLNKSVIHSRAMQGTGDWNEQLNDYCPTSGLPLDEIIHQLLNSGFDVDDLKHLERLSSPEILRLLPPAQRNLKHNMKSDVMIYLNLWISLLEGKLAEQVTLSDLNSREINMPLAIPEVLSH